MTVWVMYEPMARLMAMLDSKPKRRKRRKPRIDKELQAFYAAIGLGKDGFCTKESSR